MRLKTKGMALILALTMIMANSITVSAEEVSDIDTDKVIEVGIDKLVLEEGESIKIGDFTIICDEVTVENQNKTRLETKGPKRLRPTTKTELHKRNYRATDGSGNLWYTIRQTTCFTYDGQNVSINRDSSYFTIEKHNPGCWFQVIADKVSNYGEGKPAEYKIGVNMRMDNNSILSIMGADKITKTGKTSYWYSG